MMFSQEELDYLATQPIGRLATVDPTGMPQNNPVGFRHEPETDTIAIGGRSLSATRKFRNVAATGKVSLVVDDVASRDPWQVRGVEIRGDAEALPDGRGLIRIHPRRVVSWGITTRMQEAVARSAPAR